MTNEGETSSQTFDFKLFTEALKGELGRMMDQKLEVMYQRFDSLEMSRASSKGSRGKAYMSRVTPIRMKNMNLSKGEPSEMLDHRVTPLKALK